MVKFKFVYVIPKLWNTKCWTTGAELTTGNVLSYFLLYHKFIVPRKLRYINVKQNEKYVYNSVCAYGTIVMYHEAIWCNWSCVFLWING